MRTILIIGAMILAVASMAAQNQKLRSERNLIQDRLEAIGGSREIENVARQIDDCGLIGLLTGGVNVRPENGGAILGCAAEPTGPETGDGGISGEE
jgi:hypothetical protein